MSKDFDYKLLDNMKESDTNGEKLYYIHKLKNERKDVLLK